MISNLKNTPQNVIRIAWTFDDGPTEYTPILLDKLKKLEIVNCTWFISRFNIYKHTYWETLREIQTKGGEIAIHEIHPNLESINWFPRSTKSFASIYEAVEHFRVFYTELKENNITIKFVRLPGGEYSELISYLSYLGCPGNKLYQYAGNIIDGKEIPEQYSKVKNDWLFLLTELYNLDVKIWSGSSKNYPLLGGLPFHYNSWQAESAGVVSGRGADNITSHQAHLRKAAKIQEVNNFVFEKKLYFTVKNNLPTSILILAHDTSIEDIEEILFDIKTMKSLAEKNNAQIIFNTVSELYEAIR